MGNGMTGAVQIGERIEPSLRPLRRHRILLLGIGGVGRAFVEALAATRGDLATRLGLQLDLVAVADSSAALWSESGALPDATIASALATKRARKPLSSLADARKVSDPRSLVQLVASTEDSSGGSLIVVDTTATDATVPALLDALAGGHSIVLANKKPLSIDQEVYDRLTRAGVTDGPLALGRTRWETTCGAALPVIGVQQRLLASGDAIARITGTLSGTLGYVMTGLQEGRLFSDVVREAHRLGYTEPDPRDDLGGVDIARKALILARGLGWRMELADVQVESLYPLHMAAMSVAEFLTALPQLDAHFAQLVKNATAQGGVLRYAAQVADGRCTVGPVVVSAESPLGRLAGTDNLIEFYTRWYNPAPLVIQGRGAGVEVTASGVLADVVELAISNKHE